jgi:hypothetical protein
MHAGGGKQHGRIVLRDKRSGWYYGMALGHKKVQIQLPEFFAGHGFHILKLLLAVKISYIEYSMPVRFVNETKGTPKRRGICRRI